MTDPIQDDTPHNDKLTLKETLQGIWSLILLGLIVCALWWLIFSRSGPHLFGVPEGRQYEGSPEIEKEYK
jgi:hypothetical protein